MDITFCSSSTIATRWEGWRTRYIDWGKFTDKFHITIVENIAKLLLLSYLFSFLVSWQTQKITQMVKNISVTLGNLDLFTNALANPYLLFVVDWENAWLMGSTQRQTSPSKLCICVPVWYFCLFGALRVANAVTSWDMESSIPSILCWCELVWRTGENIVCTRKWLASSVPITRSLLTMASPTLVSLQSLMGLASLTPTTRSLMSKPWEAPWTWSYQLWPVHRYEEDWRPQSQPQEAHWGWHWQLRVVYSSEEDHHIRSQQCLGGAWWVCWGRNYHWMS